MESALDTGYRPSAKRYRDGSVQAQASTTVVGRALRRRHDALKHSGNDPAQPKGQ